MEIDGIQIGPDSSPFFIAEAGVNHNGELKKAKELIDVAVEAGADAVKFQTFTAERLVTPNANKADYQTETTGEGSQYEMLKRYELDREAHKLLLDYCSEKEITFLSTPFDRESADMLKQLGVSAIKLGSGELTNIPLIKHVAGFDLPLIVSTGMGTLEEVKEAYDTIQSVDPRADVVFLHCTSTYPCSPDDVNLRAMETIRKELDVSVGYSDHTVLSETPAFAVAAGASILEKHFTLDSTLPGPDHEASLEPEELDRAVALVHTAARIRGNPRKQPTESEQENIRTIRKSLHAASDLNSGDLLEESNIALLRPEEGISPRKYDSVVGKKIIRSISQGEPITIADIDVEVSKL
ncbi:N-acetylneuraminate synthase [Halorubrum aquaticum]|uniref:N-acetylneuraminate synthase n=1 Tax=Halorubrum aquaticum TaxID=387340 RepID=A0A1I3A7E0_9EURY|nr:N-acetylneuraminate synthase [Halorubrum aquaticum]SFH45221.1 N-acetylneuraminate synthase [Halorubrum aquaticum]